MYPSTYFEIFTRLNFRSRKLRKFVTTCPLQLVNNAATQVEFFAGGTLELVLFGKSAQLLDKNFPSNGVNFQKVPHSRTRVKSCHTLG